jgi:hypothetical protein
MPWGSCVPGQTVFLSFSYMLVGVKDPKDLQYNIIHYGKKEN